jgi:hypothetical protein
LKEVAGKASEQARAELKQRPSQFVHDFVAADSMKKA